MKYLFSPAGEADLLARVDASTLIGLDYDGTLAGISEIPEDACMRPEVSASLVQLVRLARVAVVSGRAVADVLPRLPAKPAFVLGNHGMEGLPGTAELCRRAKKLAEGWVRQLHGAENWARCPGIFIEDKILSLSIHYRMCQDRELARQLILERLGGLVPQPRIIPGHEVLNLLHPYAPDKGVAFGNLLALCGCRNAVFIGDDETDETVFARAPADWLTVRVGRAPGSAAHYCLKDQSEVGQLLQELVGRMRAP